VGRVFVIDQKKSEEKLCFLREEKMLFCEADGKPSKPHVKHVPGPEKRDGDRIDRSSLDS